MTMANPLECNMSIKLVHLEWSESKSDGKFRFSMMKNSTCKFLELLGQPEAFDSILRFFLDDTCK